MKKAFTLLELVLVFSIIAVMLSIILPSFKGVHDESSISKVKTDLAMLQTALESYKSKTGDYPNDAYTYQQDIIDQTKLFKEGLNDPFLAGAANYEYHYYKNSAGETYFLVVSPGINGEINMNLLESGGDIDLDQGRIIVREGQDDYLITNLTQVRL